MLYLQFCVGDHRYVLPAKEVISVIPVVLLRSLPQSPEYVLGMLNYHGTAIPIVDATRLLEGRKSDLRLSTRIILVTLEDLDQQQQKVGLLAEKVSNVIDLEENELLQAGSYEHSTGNVDQRAQSDSSSPRRVVVANLIPPDIQQTIFCQPSALSC